MKDGEGWIKEKEKEKESACGRISLSSLLFEILPQTEHHGTLRWRIPSAFFPHHGVFESRGRERSEMKGEKREKDMFSLSSLNVSPVNVLWTAHISIRHTHTHTESLTRRCCSQHCAVVLLTSITKGEAF